MTSFEVIGKMVASDLDVRLAPLGNIISVTIRGMKGEVTIGLDRKTAQDLISDKKFVGGLLVADREEFERIQAEGNDGT